MKPSSGPEKKPIKVVLDANVLVSAFLFRKRLQIIKELIENGAVVPCFTLRTFKELQTVFLYAKFQNVFKTLCIPPESVLEIIAESSVILETPAHVQNIIKEDPPDNHIIACATVCEAKYIISGDKHLLKLKKFQTIPILTPAQFLKKMR